MALGGPRARRAAATALALLGSSLAVAANGAASRPASAATNAPSYTHVASFGGYGHGFDGSLQFRFPRDVDADGDGDLFVLEPTLGRVRHVSADGLDLGGWGSPGTGEGELSDPRGLAVAPDGSVYVADTGNNRIQHFEADGSFLGQWGTAGPGPRQFNSPRGLDVAADGTVYVADLGNDRIQAFSSVGEFITSWDPNPGTRVLQGPTDVAAAPDDTVLVTNQRSTATVQRYTSAGAPLAQRTLDQFTALAVDVGPDGRVYLARDIEWSSSPDPVLILDADLSNPVGFGQPAPLRYPPSTIDPGGLYRPSGVTVDGDGVVTVSDGYVTARSDAVASRTDHLDRFDADGHFLGRFGTADTSDSPQLDDVADVALTPSGDQYIVELGNHRVQRLSADGSYLSHWGGPYRGAGPGRFDGPESVAIGAGGDVYVADTGNDRIQRFRPDGTFVTQWGTTGTAHGQFDGPTGVAVDGATDDVFVSDSGNHRIQRFSATGTFEAAWHGALEDPGDLVVGRGPSVYVVDRGADRLRRFTRSGGIVPLFEDRALGMNPDAPGKASVAVDGRGNVFVDHGWDWVDEFSAAGMYVRTFDFTPAPYTYPQRTAIAVDHDDRLISYLPDEGSIDQMPTGALATIRAGFDDTSGSVGAPLRAKVGVANTGTVPLTGLTVADPEAPACGGPVPDLSPGEEHVLECTVVPSASGTFTHAATLTSDQVASLTSEDAAVDVAAAPSPVLVDEWNVGGDGPEQLEAPARLAVGPAGDVFVGDLVNGVVGRYDSGGHFEARQSVPGLLDLDVDPSGNLFRLQDGIGDGNEVLTKQDAGGATQWSTPAGFATGISAGQDGRVWRVTPDIVDCTTHPPNCDVLSESKAWVHDDLGAVAGSFTVSNYTNDLAVHDGTDRVALRFASSPSISRYDRAGNAIDTLSVDPTAHHLTRDLDVDVAGRLYAAIGTAVKVFAPDGTLVARWATPADGVSVGPDGTVYVLDAHARRIRRFGFGLSGAVTGADGAPIDGAWVVAVDPATGRVNGAETDETGHYALAPGLGSRDVGFIDPSGGHAGEWFDGHPLDDLAGADPVLVSGGEPATADAELGPAGRTASVAGTVTEDGTGIPLEGVWVAALDLGDDATARAVQTDGDGHYSIDGLAGRPHLLLTFDPTGRHRIEYFDGHGTAASADQIDLAAGEATTADVGLRLRPPRAGGARIGGLIRVGGQPRRGVLVLAFDATRGSFVRAAVTGGAGRYRLDVPPGGYHLAYLDPSGTSTPEWHRDRPFLASDGRRVVVATAGAPATVNATLAASGPSGSIVGTVTGPDSEAVSGAWVAAADIATGSIMRGTVADLDGAYEIDGLQAGSYAVLVLDPSGAYAVEWYDDAPDLGSATPVVVAAGATTNVDDHLAVAP